MEERQSMGNFQMRTDLALEARESISEADSKLRGVRVEERYHEEEDIHVTKVMIDTKNAAKAMGKPMGIYVTMEAPAMVEPHFWYQSLLLSPGCPLPRDSTPPL